MQCEAEISSFQAQPCAVFQRLGGKAAKGAVPTEIRVLVVRLRRDIGPRGSREPLYRVMSLQAGLAQPALVHAAKWHPIRTTHDRPTHGSLPFPLSFSDSPLLFQGGGAHRDFGTAVICIAVMSLIPHRRRRPGGSGRGSTSTTPCAMRTR